MHSLGMVYLAEGQKMVVVSKFVVRVDLVDECKSEHEFEEPECIEQLSCSSFGLILRYGGDSQL